MALKHYKHGAHPDGKREMTIDEFIRYLEKYDTNMDGRINPEELRQVVRDHDGWFATWKGKHGVKSADTNGNGFIDKDEIPKLVEFAVKELHVRIVSY